MLINYYILKEVRTLRDLQLEKKVVEVLTEELGPKAPRVSVRDATVFLTGEAARWEDVVESGHLAAAVRGVREVVNEITWAGSPPPRVRRPPASLPSLWPPGKTVDVVIIGAGVVGCSVARELSRYQVRTVLLEMEADVASGASKANNGMVHSGINQEPGSLGGRLNVRGNSLYPELCRQLQVPFRQNGLLTVVMDEEELFLLDLLKLRAEASGIPGVTLLSRSELLERAPQLSPAVQAGASIPSTGVVNPQELTTALAENAASNEVEIFLETEVVGLLLGESHLRGVITDRGTLYCSHAINAAGIYSDEVAAMAGQKEFTIHPRKGELLVFDREAADFPDTNLGFLTLKKDPRTKGGGAVVTTEGNPQWGPTVVEVADRVDVSTSREGLQKVLAKYRELLPAFPLDSVIAFYAGIRAASYKEDFYIAPSKNARGLINLGGIQSPGLAAAPAIAEMALELLASEGLSLEEKDSFNPYREKQPSLKDAAGREDLEQLLNQDPAYGRVICRCEQVSEAEIKAAIHQPHLPATTLDGVKKRTRAGMGRCQGGFCAPRVAELLSREQGIPLTEVTKDGPGSRLFFREIKADPGKGEY